MEETRSRLRTVTVIPFQLPNQLHKTNKLKKIQTLTELESSIQHEGQGSTWLRIRKRIYSRSMLDKQQERIFSELKNLQYNHMYQHIFPCFSIRPNSEYNYPGYSNQHYLHWLTLVIIISIR